MHLGNASLGVDIVVDVVVDDDVVFFFPWLDVVLAMFIVNIAPFMIPRNPPKKILKMGSGGAGGLPQRSRDDAGVHLNTYLGR